MRYPDPELLARRCIILTNKHNEPYVAYRSNGLNPHDVWGKPVPYSAGIVFGIPEDVILTFEDYLAPFTIYSPALQLTSDLPIDAPPADIKFTPHPDAKVHTLRNYGQLVEKRALYHEWMVQTRDNSIKKLYKKALKRLGKSEDSLLLMEDRQIVVFTVAKLMCVSPALVSKILNLPIITQTDGGPNLRALGRQHSFPKSISSEHAYKLKALKAAVHRCRINAPGTANGAFFVLQDLYVQGEPGGFAVRCPVLGVDLAWDEPASLYTPRVGRRDTRIPYVSGNVLMMSMLARKMTEGITMVRLDYLLESRPALAERFKEWTERYPALPNEKTAEAVAAALRKPRSAPVEPRHQQSYTNRTPTEPVTPTSPTKDQINVRAILGGWGDTE